MKTVVAFDGNKAVTLKPRSTIPACGPLKITETKDNKMNNYKLYYYNGYPKDHHLHEKSKSCIGYLRIDVGGTSFRISDNALVQAHFSQGNSDLTYECCGFIWSHNAIFTECTIEEYLAKFGKEDIVFDALIALKKEYSQYAQTFFEIAQKVKKHIIQKTVLNHLNKIQQSTSVTTMTTKTLTQAIDFAVTSFGDKPFSIEEVYKAILKASEDKVFNVIGFVSVSNKTEIPYPSFKRSLIDFMNTRRDVYSVQFGPTFRTYKKKTKNSTRTPANKAPVNLGNSISGLNAMMFNYLSNKGNATFKQIQSALRRHLKNGETCEDLKQIVTSVKGYKVLNPNDPVSKQIVSVNS